MARPVEPSSRNYRYYAELVASMGRLATSLKIDSSGIEPELARETILAAERMQQAASKHLVRLRELAPDAQAQLKEFYTKRPKSKRSK